jgi:hypothetical protein
LLAECGGTCKNRELSSWLRAHCRGRAIATLDNHDDDTRGLGEPWYHPHNVVHFQAVFIGRQGHRTAESSAAIRVPRFNDPPESSPASGLRKSFQVPGIHRATTSSDNTESSWASNSTSSPDGSRSHTSSDEADEDLSDDWLGRNNEVLFPIVHRLAEEHLLRIRRTSLERQKVLRAEAAVQMRRTYPQLPLVRVRELTAGEEPAPGRYPTHARTERPVEEGGSTLPDIWPYGTYVQELARDGCEGS